MNVKKTIKNELFTTAYENFHFIFLKTSWDQLEPCQTNTNGAINACNSVNTFFPPPFFFEDESY